VPNDPAQHQTSKTDAGAGNLRQLNARLAVYSIVLQRSRGPYHRAEFLTQEELAVMHPATTAPPTSATSPSQCTRLLPLT